MQAFCRIPCARSQFAKRDRNRNLSSLAFGLEGNTGSRRDLAGLPKLDALCFVRFPKSFRAVVL